MGRRFLFADRRRATLTVLGVAASLLLVLVLGGIFAGAVDRVTYYIRTSPADVFVSQAGVRTMHMSASTLPADTPERVADIPGVAWAAPIAFASGSVAGPQGRQLSYLIGYDTRTRRGGPTRLVAGRTPAAGEAVLDEQAAKQLGVQVGDQFTVMGTSLRAVGFSTGGSSITNTTVFVELSEFGRIHDDRVSYVLTGLDPGADPEAVTDRIEAEVGGVTAQTREQFADSEARIVTDMSADLLRLMSSIGLVIALALVAGLTGQKTVLGHIIPARSATAGIQDGLVINVSSWAGRYASPFGPHLRLNAVTSARTASRNSRTSERNAWAA